MIKYEESCEMTCAISQLVFSSIKVQHGMCNNENQGEKRSGMDSWRTPGAEGETGHSAQQTSNTTLRRFTAMRYSYLCLIDCIGGGCCVSSVNSRSSKVRKVFGSLPECTRLQNYICNISLLNQFEQMYSGGGRIIEKKLR